nr:MAG TPA: tail-collar fiber protein [Caudoviricetes sp.]
MASQYPRNRITRGGYNLLAESIAAKKQLTFTKVVIGDGDDKGQDINTMATVLSPKMTLPVTDGRKDGDGQYLVQATLSNNEVETGFFPKEVALFAKIDGGAEIMYSYTNGGNMVGFIPDKNTPIDSEIYNIRTKIGNAENVTFSHVDSTYVTAGQLAEHNTDPNAHGGLMTKVQNEVKVATDALATHNTATNAHPPITAMIAKILGASNWQENPAATLKDIKNILGTGGIVAQRLEENGFVKFANGFIIQWGKIQDNTTASRLSYRLKEVTLPLAFSSNWYAILTTQISLFSTPKEELDRLGAIIISTKTVNKFTMQLDDYSAGAYWLAIGA